MAWLRNIVYRCQRCGRTAAVEVFNNRNSSHGYFCKRCGAAEVRRLDKEEAALAATR
jgi:hypothetical protein